MGMRTIYPCGLNKKLGSKFPEHCQLCHPPEEGWRLQLLKCFHYDNQDENIVIG